jgi:hypothetical protein
MAISPKAVYPSQVDATDPAYPHGKARNVAMAGDGSGTPLEQVWLSDLWGFLQAILQRASVTPSGQPDKVGASQYLDAIVGFINGLKSQNNIWSGLNKFAAGYIDNHWGVNGEVLYVDASGAVTPISRWLILPLSSGLSALPTGAIYQGGAGSGAVEFTSQGSWQLPVRLPRGATITSFTVLFRKYNAVGGVSCDVKASLFRVTPDFITESLPFGNTLVAGVPFVAVAEGEARTLTPADFVEVVDNAAHEYVLTAVATGAVNLLGVRIQYTDPGPRNS